jgi:hypothetical protein
MSNKKKPKKLRTPNLPVAPAAMVAPVVARSGSQEGAGASRLARPMPVAAVATANFDYTYVKKDLRRIAFLAAGFIVVLVALSFFIK